MTEIANLYETIFKRKSVRRYDPNPLDEKTLAGILSLLNTLKPLYGGIKTEVKIVPQKNVWSLQRKAPHYLAVFSEAKDGYLTNVGFMMQQMDLFLSSIGIGACWQGIPKLSKEALRSSNLKFVIVLAFGRPAKTLYRKSISEFKRKPIEQIRDFAGADELLEPARLAPSAANNQPWFFTGKEGVIHAYCTKPKFLMGAWIRIDVGIALRHIWIAAEHFGKNVEFLNNEKVLSSHPKGCHYIGTLSIK
ncbi:nitroreductase family protein [Halobacteriota archaeon]